MDRVNKLNPSKHSYNATYKNAEVFFNSTSVMDPSTFTRTDVAGPNASLIAGPGIPQGWHRSEAYPLSDPYARVSEGIMPGDVSQTIEEDEVEETPTTDSSTSDARVKKGCRTKNFTIREDTTHFRMVECEL